MLDDLSEQTIAAVATARGRGAVSIIRLSGPGAFSVLEKVFRPAGPAQPQARRLAAGDLFDPATGDRMDSVLAARFPAPHSYTGEDLAEIHTHGGVYVTNRALELVLGNGARAAWPGEFTMRAFVNGKVDLTQAEAVNEIINAHNEHALKLAIGALKGNLGDEIRRIRGILVDLLAKLEVLMEYPDENFEEISKSEITEVIRGAITEIEKLTKNFHAASMVNHGPRIAIAGRPNVGKSSLMNRLLGENRSIIHHTPGTTRDLVGDYLLVSGVSALIMDTAGIIETQNPIEIEGVERAKEFLETADLVLLMIDASEPLGVEDKSIAELIRNKRKKTIFIVNKKDLIQRIDDAEIMSEFGDFCKISALTGQGVDKVLERISKFVNSALDSLPDTAITNSRHKQLLDQARQELLTAIQNIQMPQDILTIDIRSAIDLLGRITGENTTEDILSAIFSEFCVGK